MVEQKKLWRLREGKTARPEHDAGRSCRLLQRDAEPHQQCTKRTGERPEAQTGYNLCARSVGSAEEGTEETAPAVKFRRIETNESQINIFGACAWHVAEQ